MEPLRLAAQQNDRRYFIREPVPLAEVCFSEEDQERLTVTMIAPVTRSRPLQAGQEGKLSCTFAFLASSLDASDNR
jgi:hypothetical protein